MNYRAARAESFALEIDAERISRVKNALVDTLTQDLSSNTLETFLTCRDLAEKLGDRMAEEYSLMQIYQVLNTQKPLTYADLQLIIGVLPDILPRPFKVITSIVKILAMKFLPALIEVNKQVGKWERVREFHYLQRFLNHF